MEEKTTLGKTIAFRVLNRLVDGRGVTLNADHLKSLSSQRQADGSDPAVGVEDASMTNDRLQPVADHGDDRVSLWGVHLKKGARVEFEV